MKIQSASYTHVGRRKNNEDFFGEIPELGLYIVADGMGGHEGGEVASHLTIQTICDFFKRSLEDGESTWPYALDRNLSFPENLVDTAVRLANQEVIARRIGRLASMGSTVVVLSVRGTRCVIGHVGDSRVYRVRGQETLQLTVDHSLYEYLKATTGKDMPPFEEFSHQNVITKAIGTQEKVRPDLRIETPERGDTFLLCSDGLSGVLGPSEIAAFAQNDDVAVACKNLVEAAYHKGSKDNITAVLVRVG
jgi:serine/threonine protein phosphatase PrpC